MPRNTTSKTHRYEEISGAGDLEKVIVHLKGKESGTYTKLAKRLEQLSNLEKEVAQIKDEIKDDAKKYITDLFDAEDACKTRVVQTVSVVLTLTKDPTPTKSVKYAKVLEELEQHLTPALIKVLTALKEEFQTEVKKSPSLTWHGVMPESMDGSESSSSSLWMTVIRRVRQFKTSVIEWCTRYDRELARVQSLLNS